MAENKAHQKESFYKHLKPIFRLHLDTERFLESYNLSVMKNHSARDLNNQPRLVFLFENFIVTPSSNLDCLFLELSRIT